jgi:Zn-dependent protease
MSLAGPGANFALTLVAALLIHAGLMLGAFDYPDSVNFTHIVIGVKPGIDAGAASVLSILFSLNLLLGFFNLLPLPPLDGFGAVGLLLSEDAAARFQAFGMQMRSFSMIGLLVAWRVFDPIFDSIFGLSLKVLYPTQGYGS